MEKSRQGTLIPFVPTQPRIAILRALTIYQYLTVKQVVALFYAPSSETHAYEMLQYLVSCKYVYYRRGRPRARGGSEPGYYTLDRRGRLFLESLGDGVSPRFHRREVEQLSDLHLAHLREANDVLIAAHALCKECPAISVHRMEHESAAHGVKPRVTRPDGTTTSLMHDGWLEIHCGDDAYCLWLEVDRSTEKAPQWKKKIEALVRYSETNYQADFGSSSLTVVCVAVTGDRRAGQLRLWTREVLTTLGAPALGSLFVFAGLQPRTLAPADLFLRPLWRTALDEQPVPLLDAAVDEASVSSR